MALFHHFIVTKIGVFHLKIGFFDFLPKMNCKIFHYFSHFLRKIHFFTTSISNELPQKVIFYNISCEFRKNFLKNLKNFTKNTLLLQSNSLQ